MFKVNSSFYPYSCFCIVNFVLFLFFFPMFSLCFDFLHFEYNMPRYRELYAREGSYYVLLFILLPEQFGISHHVLKALIHYYFRYFSVLWPFYFFPTICMYFTPVKITQPSFKLLFSLFHYFSLCIQFRKFPLTCLHAHSFFPPRLCPFHCWAHQKQPLYLLYCFLCLYF